MCTMSCFAARAPCLFRQTRGNGDKGWRGSTRGSDRGDEASAAAKERLGGENCVGVDDDRRWGGCGDGDD